MKIVVCVKCVPEGRFSLDPQTKVLDRGRAAEINTFDLYAVEEALRIKESSDSEVVVATIGPESSAEALRTALALGADRAVLVNDPTAVGSDMLATSKVLAKVIEREHPDLVLFGQQTSDGGGALLWSAVAEWLRLPAVSQTNKLELQAGTLRATRQTEAGDDVVETPLPAIIAVTDAINELRYASLKGKMAAKKKPLEVLALSDLGLDSAVAGSQGSMTEVLQVVAPPARGKAVWIEVEEGAAEKVMTFLVERQLV